MRSVADIPPGDDAGDELSGISPELVLVDPELARLVRERETPPGVPALPPPRRTPTLRLVPAPAVEPGIVPRPSTGTPLPPEPAEEPEPEPKGPSIVDAEPVTSAPPPPPPPPAAPAAPPPVTTAVDVAERVVDAEPARAVDPPRRPIPAPLAEPARRPSESLPPGQARHAAEALASAASAPVMPHPVKRTSVAPRPARAPRPKGRGRRIFALLAGIAAASVAVLALLQLTGGPTEPSRTAAGPRATSPAAGARHAASKPKPAPKPAATPSRSKAKAKASASAKSSAPAKPKAAASKATAKPAAKPKAAAPKATAKPKPKAAATAPAAGSTSPAGGSGAPAATRRFAWAPVAGAIGYHVELFRGAERVLVKETKEPVLELGQTWRYQGRTLTLTPGEYRWYVWSVTKSGRATQAVVQAKLTV